MSQTPIIDKIQELYNGTLVEGIDSLYYAKSFDTSVTDGIIDAMIQELYKEDPGFIASALVGPYKDKQSTDILIQWAKYIKETQQFTTFEPVLDKIRQSLQKWLQIKKVNIKSNGFLINVHINDIRPIFYSLSREPFIELLPYIAYLLTFYRHCSPYSFDESFTDSNRNEFLKNYDAQLGFLFGLSRTEMMNTRSVIMSVTNKLNLGFPIKNVLDKEYIWKVRNEEMNMTIGYLDQCIQQQMSIGQSTVDKYYQMVLDQLVNICIEKSPVVRIMKGLTNQTMNVHQLEYSEILGRLVSIVTGETMSWYIPQNECIIAPVIEKEQQKDIFKTTGRRYDFSEFPKLGFKSIGKNNMKLSIFLGILREKLGGIDPLNGQEPIRTSDLNEYNAELEQQIQSIVINGSIVLRLEHLKDIKFNEVELADIESLSKIAELLGFYELSHTIVSYVYLNLIDYIELYKNCCHRVSAKNPQFNLMTYFLFKKSTDTKYKFIHDIYSNLLLMGTQKFKELLDEVVILYQKVSDAQVIIPYVRGLSDDASKYALVGVRTYDTAKLPNSIMRSYYFIRDYIGSCKEIEDCISLVRLLNDAKVLELIEELEDPTNVILTALNKLKLQNLPICRFKDGKLINPAVVLTKKVGMVKVLEFLRSMKLKRASAADTIEPIIEFSYFMNGEYKVGSDSALRLNDYGTYEEIPYYSYVGQLEPIKVSVPGRMTSAFKVNTGYNVLWLFVLGN